MRVLCNHFSLLRIFLALKLNQKPHRTTLTRIGLTLNMSWNEILPNFLCCAPQKKEDRRIWNMMVSKC